MSSSETEIRKLPFNWAELSEAERDEIKTSFPRSVFNDLVRYETGLVMWRHYAEQLADRIYNFKLREDDVWVVTFPKAGTTMTQELVWSLVHGLENELIGTSIRVRSPFLEIVVPTDESWTEVFNPTIDLADNMTGRRIIKSHLPLEFLPPGLLDKCKVVYVARNVKDTIVSYYHHNLLLDWHGFKGTFSQFLQHFKDGILPYGSYWYHLRTAYNARNNPNLKFLWFEDMKRDQKKVTRELARFLNVPVTEEQLEALEQHVKFENMKKRAAANPCGKEEFFRKGIIGDWKSLFSCEQEREIDRWTRDNVKGTQLEKETNIFSQATTETGL